MRAKHWATIVMLLPLLVVGKIVRADDIRPAMEAANAQFLMAFNTPNPAAFISLYTADAVLFFQGAPHVTGPEAIKQFWGGHGSSSVLGIMPSTSSRPMWTASMRFKSPRQPSDWCATQVRRLLSPDTP